METRPDEVEVRVHLRELNPDITDDELDAVELSIFDCGGCG